MALTKRHIEDLLGIMLGDESKPALAAASTLIRLGQHLEEVKVAMEALADNSQGLTKVKAIDLLDKIPQPKVEVEESSKDMEQLEADLRKEYGC